MALAPATRPARYRLYLDESGDHTYNLLDEPSHRYLALLGVWFRQADHYVAFADNLERFKRGIFGPRPDKPVILHRSDIINRKGAFGILCNAEVRQRFDVELLEVIGRAVFRMVCVVIDKRTHSEKYNQPLPSLSLLPGGDAGPLQWLAGLQERSGRCHGRITRGRRGLAAYASLSPRL